MSTPNATMTGEAGFPRVSSRALAWWGAALVLAIAAYGPLLWMFFRQQWQKPHYQYFPFVIAAFGWLFWSRLKDAPPRVPARAGGRWFDASILLAAIGLLVVAIGLRSPWGAVGSFILLAAYACRVVTRTYDVTNIWAVWIILWLLVPLPFGYDGELIRRLQALSSQISSAVLDLFGVSHVMEGNTLWVPAKKLFVSEACSGIVSILSVVACAVIYAVFRNRTPIHLALLAVGGIFWATIVNVGRISIIAIALEKWGIDWSAGWQHETLSLVLFMVTFLALLSTDHVLEVCLAPVAERWHEVHANDLWYGAIPARLWDWLVSWGAAEEVEEEALANAARTFRQRLALPWVPLLLFIPLAVAQAALFAYALSVSPARSVAVQRAVALTEIALPETLQGMKQTDFLAEKRSEDNIHGMYSRTYTYGNGKDAFVVSFDFPFSGGWHELTECYAANGWERGERRVVDPSSAEDEQPWPFVEATFSKPGQGYGAVFFAEFDQNGQPLTPVEGWVRPSDSYFRVRNYYLEERKTFQVQVWVVSPGPVGEAQRERAGKLLLEARELCRDKAVSASERGALDPPPQPK